MTTKLPSFNFYIGDWQKHPDLARATKAEKGLLIDILCLMWESEERGVLATAGKPWSDQEIVFAAGGDSAENLVLLQALLSKRILHRNNSAAIFSPRMVREESIRQKCIESGKRGGNPNLVKGGVKGGVKGNANRKPTPSSSSSSSSSSSKQQDNIYNGDRGVGKGGNNGHDTANDTANDVASPEKSALKTVVVVPGGDTLSADKLPVGNMLKSVVKTSVDITGNPGNPEKAPKSRFIQPNPDEVTAYARSLGFELEGHRFCDFYASKGWVVGKSPMKDWRAAVRTWKAMRNGQEGIAKPEAEIPDEIRYVLTGFRMAKGVPDEQEKQWNETFLQRYRQNAEQLLKFFNKDWKKAVDCIQDLSESMQNKGLDWGWQAIFNFAANYNTKLKV